MKKFLVLMLFTFVLVGCDTNYELNNPTLKGAKYVGVAHKSGCSSVSCHDTVTFEHKDKSYNFLLSSTQTGLLVVDSTYDIEYIKKSKYIKSFDVAGTTSPELEY